MRHTEAELSGSRAAVFLFIGTTCPLSNGYAPEFQRLFLKYSPRAVRFYAVYSEPFLRFADARKHAAEFGYRFPGLFDPSQTIALQTGATVTPQAVVLGPDRRLLYRGRIDDRTVEIGKARPQPARHDLRQALDAVLDKPLPVHETKAIGCAIPFPAKSHASAITFTGDVAPILYQHCASCHRPGQIAPFPLLTYSDAAPRAALIAGVAANRTMPPWKPEPGPIPFQNKNRLTVAEIDIFQRWAAVGAPEGDPRKLPASPQFRDGWKLGQPDLVVTMPEPFPGSGRRA